MTDPTKKVLRKLLEDAYSWAHAQAHKARKAYAGRDMNFVVNEAGETRQKILDSYVKSEAEITSAFKEVFPEWEPHVESR